MFRHFVESGIYHLASHRTLHVRDFLRTFVDEEHEEDDVGIVLRNGAGYHFEKRGFARLGRRNDDPALPLADGRHDVYAPRGVIARTGRHFHAQSFVGIDRDQIVEVRTFTQLGVVHSVDGDDVHDRGGFALLQSLAHGSYFVALAQSVLLDLHAGHIGVHLIAFAVAHSQEAVSVGIDFEETFAHLVRLAAALVVVESGSLFGFVPSGVVPAVSVAARSGLFGRLRGLGSLRRKLGRLLGPAAPRRFRRFHLAGGYFQYQIDKFRLVFLRRRRNAHLFSYVADRKDAYGLKHLLGVS